MKLVDPMTTWATAREALAAQGYALPPEPSTHWQRIRAAGKAERNRSASVRLADDGAAVHLVDHANGYATTVHAKHARPVDPVTATARRARADIERRQAVARAEAVRERTAALAGAQRVLDGAAPGDGHPYITAKLLAHAHGARQADGWLLVPGRDERGQLAFVQRIAADGTKRLVRGTSFKGAFVTFGEPVDGERIVIATGWATSAVVFEDTATTTLAAMCDNNLERVARIAGTRWPFSPRVIAGDDDRHSAMNSGHEAAEAATRATGARVLFPTFCRPDCNCSDFADVRACVRGAVRA